MVVCFVLEWQIACVRAVKFPVKIPVIHWCNNPCCRSAHREDPGGSHVSSCRSLCPARPACVSHTLPPDAEEGVCVWGLQVSIHPEQLSLSDLDTHSRHWMTYDWLVLQKDQACDHCVLLLLLPLADLAHCYRATFPKKKKTTDYGRSEFIMKKQASQFPYRPIFNISDRCLFSVSNQIVYFSCLCPQLFKNISLTPSLPLIHHSTYRGHEEVSVWVVFLCFLLCDISFLI